MALPARNSLKGYTYQSYVFTLFTAIMDSQREISQIEVETIVDHQFDDINIQADKKYYLQVKDYPNTTIEDIVISDKEVKIKNVKCKYKEGNCNIVVVNTDLIETDETILGFPCKNINNIYIVPLSTETISDMLDNTYSNENRENQIINFCLKRISDAVLTTTIDDLPEFVRIKHDLDSKTIILREPLTPWEPGITCIIGKPGVGKSHYVNELKEEYLDAVVYRFWTGSQDERLKDRLLFSTFINDIALNIFGTTKKFTEDELIDKIMSSKTKIIIDGLDHIENYNPHELDLFFEFINKLSETYVIVLTRPLKRTIDWRKHYLANWTNDQTTVYINREYPEYNYKTVERIFEITKGYPIITYFLCEHYRIHKAIPYANEIIEIEQYYNSLIENVNTKNCLSLFSVNDSFFTRKEIADLLNNKMLESILAEFISDYPYLFNVIQNRVSLIHDSFNTYIRLRLKDEFADYNGAISKKIKNSIMNTEVEYLSRLSSFHFDDDFYCEVAKKYVRKEIFRLLCNSTSDYESIVSLYKQLRLIIDKNQNAYNIYEYYSLALIYQTVARNDMIGNEEILYQIIVYHQKNEEDLDNLIFSSGSLWHLYLSLKDKDFSRYERYMETTNYGSYQIDEIAYNLKEEIQFFNKKGESIESCINTLRSEEFNYIYSADFIAENLAYGWIEKTEPFYSIVNDYLISKDINAAAKKISDLFEKAIFDMREAKRIIRRTNYRLKEYGVLPESKEFREYTLKDYIILKSNETSFEVSTYVLSYIRLANHEKRDIDIYSVNMFFNMHYAHKDYSIANIDKALIVFEKNECIDEDESVKILAKSLNQMERGIRGLYSTYINGKDDNFIKKIFSDSKKYNTDWIVINQLSPQKIELLPKKFVYEYIFDTIGRSMRSKSIDYSNISNLLKTKYCKPILDIASDYNLSLYFVYPKASIISTLDERGIEYSFGNYGDIDEIYEPLKYGHIHESDFDYIKQNKMSYLETSMLTGAGYDCFPFVELFDLYEIELIKNNYMTIIHNLLFSKIKSLGSIGNWCLVVGNLPNFLSKFEIDVDWNKLFDVFDFFLEISLLKD